MSGFRYFIRGLSLILEPGIRGFVAIPLLINLLVFAGVSWFLWQLTGDMTAWAVETLGEWVKSIIWLLYLVLGILWLIIYGYSFSMISNTIAAPFYGLLAERVQARVSGDLQGEALTFAAFMVMVRRAFVREWQKLLYLLPRLLLLLVVSLPLYFIPVIGMLVPVMWFVWGAWSLALENIDYVADNNQVTFPAMKQSMKVRRVFCLSFGSAAVIAASIPLFNLLAVPAAVAGGTAMWLEQWPQQDSEKSSGTQL